jgi:hypothetical protein
MLALVFCASFAGYRLIQAVVCTKTGPKKIGPVIATIVKQLTKCAIPTSAKVPSPRPQPYLLFLRIKWPMCAPPVSPRGPAHTGLGRGRRRCQMPPKNPEAALPRC